MDQKHTGAIVLINFKQGQPDEWQGRAGLKSSMCA